MKIKQKKGKPETDLPTWNYADVKREGYFTSNPSS